MQEVELCPWELPALTDHIYQHRVTLFKQDNVYFAELEIELCFPNSYPISSRAAYNIPYMDESNEYWNEFRKVMIQNAESLALDIIYAKFHIYYPNLFLFFPPFRERQHLYGIITHQFYFSLIITSSQFFRGMLQLTPAQAAFFKDANIVKLQRENLVSFEQLERIRSPAYMQRLCAPAAYLLLSNRVCNFLQLLALSKAAYRLVSTAFYTHLLINRTIEWEDCAIDSDELVTLLSFPTISNAMAKGTLTFATALKLNPCMRALFTSSWYAEYFARADCDWSQWTRLEPYHLPGFLHSQLAPILSQRELPASGILNLQAYHFTLFEDSSLCRLVQAKKIRLIELCLMSKEQIETLMRAPILQTLLHEFYLDGLKIISIFEATSMHMQRQKAYAKALSIIYFSHPMGAENPTFLQVMIGAAQECEVSLANFLQAFLHEIAHRQRLLLNDTHMGNTNNRQDFRLYLLQLNSLFEMEDAPLDIALSKLQSLITDAKYALEMIKTNSHASPKLFSNRTPLEKWQAYLQSMTRLKPLLEMIHHCLNEASVGRSLRSPTA